MFLHTFLSKQFLVIILIIFNITYVVNVCPDLCQCKKINDTGTNLKVKCGGTSQKKIVSAKDLNFGADFVNILQLDLSKNFISSISSQDFINYTSLNVLDLSFNQIKRIGHNELGEIKTLEKLKLTSNNIAHILQGAFNNLTSLKSLDISGNPLACDCDLLWLVSWSNIHQVKLKPSPKCETPAPFKGLVLKKLQVGSDLHCDTPFQPILELKPEKDQLVFEGDDLVLRCRAPRVAVGAAKESEDLPVKSHLFWGWSKKIIDPNSTDDIHYLDPRTEFKTDLEIDAKHLSDFGFLDSMLKIKNISEKHAGMWDCRLKSLYANLSRSISVVVISNKTKYCAANVTKNNKGKYFWPRTVRGRIVNLPCIEEISKQEVASHLCNESGYWIDLNTESCPFISETTRIFQQFSQFDLSLSKDRVLDTATRLNNFTQSKENLKKIRDTMDIFFLIKTLKNYLPFVSLNNELGSIILNIVSQMLTLPHQLALKAELIDKSGLSLLSIVEETAQQTPPSLTHKTHLAIDYFSITAYSFNGLMCTWMKTENSSSNLRVFQCNYSGQSVDIFRQHVDASVQIPLAVIGSQNYKYLFPQKLMIAFYENSNILPFYNNNSNLQITSCIVGVKLIADSINPINNLSEPISIMLRAKPYHNDISNPMPVWWDPETLTWTQKTCKTLYYYHGFLVFSCIKFGYYGLLQNLEYLNDFPDDHSGAKFRYSPLGFYIGSFVLFICCWINIVTYVACGRTILMARRQRHSLVNTWIALSLLALIFALGIYQTKDYRYCQYIGISIHYLSLCVLLWICVSVSNMYKHISKRNRVLIDEFPKENVGKKPILGIYLVGWGIGIIICGISGAVNMREYSSYHFCFFFHWTFVKCYICPSYNFTSLFINTFSLYSMSYSY